MPAKSLFEIHSKFQTKAKSVAYIYNHSINQRKCTYKVVESFLNHTLSHKSPPLVERGSLTIKELGTPSK